MAVKKQSKRPTTAVYIGGDPRNVDLIVGKVYRILKAERNDQRHDLRVIDESGEDYLYPLQWFVPLEVPSKVRRVLSRIN